MDDAEEPRARREPGEPPGPPNPAPTPGPPNEVPPAPDEPPPGPSEVPLPDEVPPAPPEGPGLPGGGGGPAPGGEAHPPPAMAAPPSRPHPLAERPETAVEVPSGRLAAQSRRDFLLFAAGVATAVAGTWWLAPDRVQARWLGERGAARVDGLCGRLGLSAGNRERVLDRAMRLDDDIAAALFSKDRPVRTYDRSQVTPLRNNYNGQTPGSAYLAGWNLRLSGLASGRVERLPLARVLELPLREQVTRLVCVEGWSAVAWWHGVRFADVLGAFPPAPGARWAALRSSVNLDGAGRPDPYYVSIDLETARHPQTLLATRLDGLPLTVEHGAPVRLLAPMKLGLKNIKAITDIAYTVDEPPDYWHERGYSAYDGL
jgi:DMSO/TMAO reductase YedYZ molybdopterin-dependent catalytic subunit